jgi:hypothetical protein
MINGRTADARMTTPVILGNDPSRGEHISSVGDGKCIVHILLDQDDGVMPWSRS